MIHLEFGMKRSKKHYYNCWEGTVPCSCDMTSVDHLQEHWLVMWLTLTSGVTIFFQEQIIRKQVNTP